MKRLILLLGLVVVGYGQNLPPQNVINFTAPAPPSINTVSTRRVGNPGLASYYYWVVGNYSGGSVMPTVSSQITSAPSPLTVSNYVTVNWTSTGATTYTVLRTSSPNPPSANCVGCVVGSTAGVTIDDTGSALTDLSVTVKGAASGYIQLNNSGATPSFSTSPSLSGGGAWKNNAGTVVTPREYSRTSTGLTLGDNGTDTLVLVDTTVIPTIASLQAGGATFFVDSGAANAIAGCPTTSVAPSDGMRLLIKVLATNTSATTINLCTNGAKKLWIFGKELLPGALIASSYLLVSYSSTEDGGNGAYNAIGVVGYQSNYYKQMKIEEEFITGRDSSQSLGTNGYVYANGSTGYQVVAGRPGVFRRTTGTTPDTNTYLGASFNFTAGWLLSEQFSVKWGIRPVQIDNASIQRVGLICASYGSATDASNTPPNDGVYFERLDTDTNWFAVNRASSVSSARTDTGVAAAANTWVELEIGRVGADIVYRINGTQVAAISTNITAQGCIPWLVLWNTGAVSKDIDVDYNYVWVGGLSR